MLPARTTKKLSPLLSAPNRRLTSCTNLQYHEQFTSDFEPEEQAQLEIAAVDADGTSLIATVKYGLYLLRLNLTSTLQTGTCLLLRCQLNPKKSEINC